MSATTSTQADKAALLRDASRSLVAERGLHDASVSAIAAKAGVAAGTLYVHYASKEELLSAAHSEAKRELGEAAVAAVSPDLPPRERFIALWFAVHDHLAADRERARFLLQVEAAPTARGASEGHGEGTGEPGELEQFAAAPDMAPLLIEVPPKVLFELALGPAVRIAAGLGVDDRSGLMTVAGACWRAITREDGAAGD